MLSDTSEQSKLAERLARGDEEEQSRKKGRERGSQSRKKEKKKGMVVTSRALRRSRRGFVLSLSSSARLASGLAFGPPSGSG